VILEKGLAERVELIHSDPFGDSEALTGANPLGKVPALVLPDGQAIFDSAVICAYLDSLSGANPLIPKAPADRWATLSGAALADGILDAAFATVVERRRPEVQQSPMWLDRWRTAMLRSISSVEDNDAKFSGDISLAQIGLATALGYLDFRLPDVDWRAGHPNVSRWYADTCNRPSIHSTHPQNS